MKTSMSAAVAVFGALLTVGCGGVEGNEAPASVIDGAEVATTAQAITYNDYNYVCAVDLWLRYQPGGDGFCTLHKWDIVYAYYPPSGDYADVWVYSSADPNCVNRRGWAMKSYISRSCP